MSTPMIRMIHAACRQLGLDEEDRRQMQVTLTGKDSLKKMTQPELKLVANHLRQRGAGHTKRPASKDARIRMIHVLWRKLGEAGELRDASRKGLNAFIRTRFEASWGTMPLDVDQLREPLQIDDVVQALKAWGRRAGIDFDFGGHRK